jgi:serine/threonine protein kinase
MSDNSGLPPQEIAARLGPGSRVAGYVLEERVGAGGMAVVFRARDETLGRLAAVKVLSPALAADQDFRVRFLNESRSVAAVDEPHIVPVYAAGESGGVLYIATRFVAGGDLAGLLRRAAGPLATGRAAALITQVAAALDAAHAIGLVHRDVKPGNVLIETLPGRPEHAYLSDFGLSKSAFAATGLTPTGAFLGTPDYCAPEQVTGVPPVSARTDQYALGCMAFRLLTGTVPYRREDALVTLFAHIQDPVPALTPLRPQLPQAVDAVVARAMAKSPADRYESCGQFAAALREALIPPGGLTAPASPPAASSGADQPAVAPVASPALALPDPPPAIVLASAGAPSPDARPQAETTTRSLAMGNDSFAPLRPVAATPGPGTTMPGNWAPGDLGTPPAAAPARRARRARRKKVIIAVSAASALLVGGGIAAAVVLPSLLVGNLNCTRGKPNPAGDGAVGFPVPNADCVFPLVTAFSRDGTLVAGESGGQLNAIYVWNAVTHQYLTTLTTPHHEALVGGDFAFSAGDKTLTYADEFGDIYQWNLPESVGQLVYRLSVNAVGSYNIAISGDASTMAVTDNSRSGDGVDIINIATGTITADLTDPDSAPLFPGSAVVGTGLSLSADGSRLTVGDSKGKLYVWNVRSRHVIATLHYDEAKADKNDENAAFISGDGTWVFIPDGPQGMSDSLWDVASEANVTPRDARWPRSSRQSSTGLVAAFSDSGQFIATQRVDGSGADLWNAATGAHVASFSYRSVSLFLQGLSPDGTEILVIDGNQEPWTWRFP